MNTGAFGENFPYTNFHALNLDWIIKTLKSVDSDYNSVKEFIPLIPQINAQLEALEDLPEEFEDYKDEINAWKTEITNQMTRLQQTVESYISPLSNIICLTDSYGLDSVNNNRLSWCTQLRDMCNLTDNVNYRKIFVSGGSFGNSDSTKNLQVAFVNGTQSMTQAQKDAVTDIIIEEGVNEWMQDNTYMVTSMGALNTYIRSNFPNAKVSLFGCGWDFQPEIRYALWGKSNSIYHIFKETADNLKWNCVVNISAMITKTNYFDDVHPNIQGSKQIAGIIYNALKYNQNKIYNQHIRSVMQIVTNANTRTLGYIEFDGTNYYLSPSTVGLDAIPDIPSGFTGQCKLGKVNTDAVIGYDSSIVPSPISPLCKLGVYSNNAWHQYEGRLLFTWENDELYLYFKNNGDFATIPTPGSSNATNSYLAFSPLVIPVWA